MRDPAVYSAVIMAMLAIQLLVWSIARTVSDTEWYYAFLLGILVTTGASIFSIFHESLPNAAACIFAIALVTWIICGFVYDLDLWQRIVMTVASPFIGIGALMGGFALREAVFGW